MAAKMHVESRRHYSWWWDSHISPKNSKWLQENLSDLDVFLSAGDASRSGILHGYTDIKVNTIIKLLEEDADSFARRAEMYYKKRPELMKLVEELYRAYRALAEKYDHATGALRQAHRTMTEAFPNQIPLVLSDESPYGSGNEAEPHTPDMPPPLRALFDPDDLQRDALGLSSDSHVIKRNGAYSEQSASLSTKKGLKQLNEMFATGDGAARATSEGRAKKGLNFQEEGGSVHNITQKLSREQNKFKEKEDASYAPKGLKQEISWLTAECQNLKNQIMAESGRADKAENELHSLKETISRLISEKDEDHNQCQASLEKISFLESHLSTTQNELKKLNDEMVSRVKKLEDTEERNQTLLLDIEMLMRKANMQEHELNQKKEELEKLHINTEDMHQQCLQAEMALALKEKLHTQSQEELIHSSQEIQKGINKLKDMELCNVDLLDQICKIKVENDNLNEQNHHSTLMIKELQNKIILLEENKRILEHEVGILIGEKQILTQEFCHIKEDKNDLEGKHRELMVEMAAVSIRAESLEMATKDLRNENSELNDIWKKHESEKELLVEKLKDMDNILEKNVVLENSLSGANVELQVLREKILALEDSHESLNSEISNYIAEKNALVSQVEILTKDVDALSGKNTFLEKSLTDLSTEVGCLRLKLKNVEESYQSLCSKFSDLLAERNALLGQVDILTQNVEKLSDKNSFLENSLSDASSKVECLRSKLKNSEESCQTLSNQNSGILVERNTLFSQVEIVTKDVDTLSGKNSILENSLTELSTEVGCLRLKLKNVEESYQSLSNQNSDLLAEKNTLLCEVEILTKNVEKLSDKNSFLEKSLSDTSSEVECLRSKLKNSEESCQTLSNQNSGLLVERNTLFSQIEILNKDVDMLSDKNTFFENSLSDLSTEVGCLRLKLKNVEESYQSLNSQNSDLLAEKSALLCQVEILSKNVEKLSDKNSFLEKSLSDAISEVECLWSKLKNSEESCQTLSNHNSGLLVERNTLFSRVEILTLDVENLKEKNSSLENSLSDVSSEVGCLSSKLKDSEDSCQSLNNQNSSLLAEMNPLLSQVKILTRKVEKLSDKNTSLENSLSDVSSELGCLRSKLKGSEESCLSLTDQNSCLVAEKAALASQVEVLTQKTEKLLHKISSLENSLSDVNSEVEYLRSKLKNFEESCQSLNDQNSGLLSERSSLLSQVEILTQNVEKLSDKNFFFENSLTDASSEVECLKSQLKETEAYAQSLNDLNAGFLVEKNNHLSQIEILTQNMEELLDKNSFLENTLSDISTEVGCLRSKLNDFEEFCQSLREQNSGLLAERNNLLSKVEILTQDLEKLSDKNYFLEKFLSDVNAEASCLMLKLKDFEETCQSLRDQNSGFLVEKNNLVSQVESITLDLENLESRFLDLKEKNLKLTRENDLIINEVKELQDHLKLEKEKHETLTQSYKSQLATLESQIFVLHQENQLKENELEAEHNNLIGALIGNFVLQSSLSDVNGRNMSLSIECQKHLQTHRRAETLISELEQEKVMHVKDMMLLSEQKEKFSSGICLLGKILTIDKASSSFDLVQDEIDIILAEIKKLLNFISETEGDNQRLHLEISVLVTLLRHTILDVVSLRLEKCSLQRELDIKTEDLLALESKKHELLGLNENLMKDAEASNERVLVLETEMKALHVQLSDLQESLRTSKCDILNLIEEKNILVEEFYNLRQKHNMLEEEHIEVLAEAMKLDHLYLLFKSLSADRLLELKSLSYDLDSLHVIKNGLHDDISKLSGKIRVLEAEKMRLTESITYLEENFRNHLLLSEFDLIAAANVYEELNLQRQSIENQLILKQTQLSETNRELHSTQQKNLELCRILEDLQLDNEAGKLVKEELEQKISTLSEALAHRNDEIRCLHEANEMLKEQINQMCKEVKVLVSKEEVLISELQKEIAENEFCEGEITALLSDIQVSAVNAALYEEKFHELILVGEVSSTLQKQMLQVEVALVKEYVDNLKKKTDVLEAENSQLKAVLDIYLSLVTSLWNGITSLEKQIIMMSKLGSNHHGKEDLSLVPHLRHSYSHLAEGHKGMDDKGVPELEKLITKVEALQKVLIDMGSHRDHEKLDGSANSEELNDAEISSRKHGQMTKDIQLDDDFSSFRHRTIGSSGLSKIINVEIDDQLWEAAERDCSNQTRRASTAAMDHDIELVEEVKSEYPSSELVVEKELSIDKLEISDRALAPRQEWAKRVHGRLEADAQKLSDLKTNVKELKRKMEGPQMGKFPASYGLDAIKAQLKDAEGAVMELMDANNKLTSKVEEYHSSDGMGTVSEESGSTRKRRQISEQARRESEKVGRLELELHKIQYVLLKLEEKQVNRHTKVGDRSRIHLRDFIYGRRDGRGQTKKSSFCGCMRPKTKADH